MAVLICRPRCPCVFLIEAERVGVLLVYYYSQIMRLGELQSGIINGRVVSSHVVEIRIELFKLACCS